MPTLPFDRPNLLRSRYAAIVPPGARSPMSSDDECDETEKRETQPYAAFLKDKERYCGPDGFLDSLRYRHNFTVKREKTEIRETERAKTWNGIDLVNQAEREQSDHDRRLKVIEDHMWQHKQEERELKRVEGDIIKNQRIVRMTLRDYDNAITRKKMSEEKKLNHNLEKYMVMQKQHLHKKEEIGKQRMDENSQLQQTQKVAGRKVQLVTSDLARQYRTKISEIDLKRVQFGQLSKEYETKLRSKEEEQLKLKQELAELAISMNMEAQKGRTQDVTYKGEKDRKKLLKIQTDRNMEIDLDNKLGKSDGDLKSSTVERRKLSASLTLTKAHLQSKQREDTRHKQDVDLRLRSNVTEQKQLTDASLQVTLDLKAKKIDQKVQVHDTRKRTQDAHTQRDRRERAVQHAEFYRTKFEKRHSEQQYRGHEDHMKHFQKAVMKGEDIEQLLYGRVKTAEHARQFSDQKVRRLQLELAELKRMNAIRIQQELADVEAVEKELEHRLQRESSKLTKAHVQREETYTSLQKQRDVLRADRYLLSEHAREHEWLKRVSQRSTDLAPLQQSYG